MSSLRHGSGVAIALMALGSITSFGATVEGPTFTKDVAPILFENCTSCHQPGQSAPMSLLSYREVRPWAKSIQKNVSERTMPPWHASSEFGTFSNDRSLTRDEVDTIVNWVNEGTPRGDKADMPALPELATNGWSLGEPDLVVVYDTVSLPAGGADQFFDLFGDPKLDEDRWLTAVEMKPSNPLVAHHVILYQMERGSGASPNGWLGAWAAGAQPMAFQEGTGRLLKKGSKIVADMHYHPAETAEEDVLSVGLFFANDKSDIEKELVNLWIVNQNIDIAPGQENYVRNAEYTFKQDSQILSFLPHMHYRGRQFTYTAKYLDGRSETLLHVPAYDFSWQTQYQLAEPLSVPAGTVIACEAHYDNSSNNPFNPDPTKRVTIGDESFDEMMIGFIDYIVDDGVSPPDAGLVIEAKLEEFKRLDSNSTYSIKFAGQFSSALYLPVGSAGAQWHLAALGEAREIALDNIAWKGNEFSADADLAVLGSFSLTGSVDPVNGTVKGKVSTADGDMIPFFGKLAN